MRIAKTALSITLSASALLYGSNTLADTQILTSIKPLELLVRAVATDDMHTTTLVPPGSSPHNYSMTPSKRRALESADVIFWVGPEMETFLTRLLTGSEFGERSVALMSSDVESTEEDHDHAHHDDHEEHHEHEAHDEHEAHHEQEEQVTHDDHGHGHDHGDGEDPHIWVDPQMAITMAESIRDALAQLDGADQTTLDRNLEKFKASVARKEEQIRKQLEPLKDISLFAYHSAFTPFGEHYNLNVEGVLTLNPELSPGARHIAEVQETLRSANHPCLLTEPQFNRQWWHSVTEGLDVTFSTWDPLATDIAATANGYEAFQQSIADAVLKCLPENAEH
ncbi:zinc ABC transporter substrate-binding protein [Marinobacter sp. 1_MG-2023]|uniref:zinc ABC transporter substrate-binding protein n=1 Tax=Marinobacter sp. 1_MG-2023 TaxID=3062627 RepID=UPI0026E16B22|nr:zinc ABC transporter substrate-binding protein [Marinobacter sp. 1_MG-2023]MDO6823540.1 zinc ABC transporter substrate-binding protein [Marinobacter sp. 1_MG-2023]